PVSTSTRICDSAAARDAARLTVMPVASARISVRPMVDSCKNITTQSAFGWPPESRAPSRPSTLSNHCGVQMQNGTPPMHRIQVAEKRANFGGVYLILLLDCAHNAIWPSGICSKVNSEYHSRILAGSLTP